MHTFLYVISCNTYLLLNITSIPALKCEGQVGDLKQLKLQTQGAMRPVQTKILSPLSVILSKARLLYA